MQLRAGLMAMSEKEITIDDVKVPAIAPEKA